MNEKVLRSLEYNKIIATLSDYSSSPPGRAICESLLPMTDIEDINKSLSETDAAFNMLVKKGNISFGSNKDITRTIRALDIDSCLTQIELIDISRLLTNVIRVKRYSQGDDRTSNIAGVLSEYFECLVALPDLINMIDHALPSEDEVSDDASPKLRSIRRLITNTTEALRAKLNSMVNSTHRTYLQDSVITIRNDRYCIPVKVEYKNQVDGMVHDRSQSGSTLFVEPAAIVALNNKLRELELNERDEIHAILVALSAEVSLYSDSIMLNHKLMTHLDFTYAKGRLALEQSSCMPTFNTNGYINIKRGRHPLINRKQVVPIDIKLGDPYRMLIITGPNTGGKTVSLKTVGLLTLMGQSGLLIPAGDSSELSVFNEIYGDIGDEQSIEQSLSTFSSHMTNIIHILKYADANSLCLFDELGAGTDPTEGAALAIAILEFLRERSITTMATTHYSELKIYALNTAYVENASCEFNIDTLRPTYRLLMGIPGKSNAFAISSKLGLPDDIINVAKSHITSDGERFEDVISRLEQSRIVAENVEADIKLRLKALEEKEYKLIKDMEKIEANRNKILDEAREDARLILSEAKETADTTIRYMRKHSDPTLLKELECGREIIRNQLKKNAGKTTLEPKNTPTKTINTDTIKVGDTVKIHGMGLSGSISSLPDASGNLFVQCGALRTKTNIKHLELINKDTIEINNKTNRSINRQGKLNLSATMHINSEINLIGKNSEEALYELDKYLDDAFMARIPSVRIVHGKGSGILRKSIHQHLKGIKYIKSFRDGEYGEGDKGVTIAVFKE